MANIIYLCCRSDRPITYGELEDYMGHWGWLDEPATFDPPRERVDWNDPAWSSFSLTFRPGRRAIEVCQLVAPDTVRRQLDELIGQLRDEGAEEGSAAVFQHLNDTKQVIAFELPAELPADVWEMLDATEANFARQYDGIVIADDGVYDAELEQIFKRR